MLDGTGFTANASNLVSKNPRDYRNNGSSASKAGICHLLTFNLDRLLAPWDLKSVECVLCNVSVVVLTGAPGCEFILHQ